MKKIVSVLLCTIFVLSLASCSGDGGEEYTTVDADFQNVEEIEIPIVTEEVTAENIAEYEDLKPENSQVGLVVDSWLKIVSIGERNGRLCVMVRNISDIDVQYANFSVMCENEKLVFEVSTLISGAAAVISCQSQVPFNVNGRYYSWKVEDKILFTEELSTYPDVFEIKGADGYISVTNISGKKIEGPIFVYYKSVEDGVFAEGTTYRVSVDTLKKGQEIQVPANHYKKDTSLVMFVTYAK